MITVKEFPNRSFTSLDELHKALIDELPTLTAARKSAIKHTDGFGLTYTDEAVVKAIADKSESAPADNPTEIRRKVVLNTTGLLDSHGDVHIKGIWKRTIAHNPSKLHLQEHIRAFDKVIASDATASTKTMTWKELGAPYEGSTQALLFDSTIKQERNAFMFEQYKNGYVNNHSVGMQYVEMHLCVNSTDEWAKEAKANWDKYYPEVVNPEAADQTKYFWAVTEAKLLEGSAVLVGSNWVTPTLENKSENAPDAPLNTDPLQGTQNELKTFYESLKF